MNSSIAIKKGLLSIIFYLLVGVMPTLAFAGPGISVQDSLFQLEFNDGAITSLKYTGDRYDTDYILEGQRFGDIIVRYRQTEGDDWSEISTKHLAENNKFDGVWDEKAGKYTAVAELEDLVLRFSFVMDRQELLWDIELINQSRQPIEVGDIALPFPMNHDWTWNREVTYNERVVRHSMVSGHNSFMYWMRPNSEPPYLLMTPSGDTKLEYYDHSTKNENDRSIYTAYIYSEAQKDMISENNGSWRLPQTAFVLQPEEQPGDHWKGGFRFKWGSDYDQIRQMLYEDGLFNIEVAPGMTVPTGLPVKIALKNKADINRIEAEHPGQSRITYIRTNSDGTHIYEVDFRELGENKLTVSYGNDRKMYLEFFVTEPIETLIRKRGRFLVNRQQIRDKKKWYDGLLSDWSMKDELLLTPDDIHDIPEGRRYMVSSDDPALSRPSFLAKKNVAYPDQDEVNALDYYIENFVWGGLQMTTEESYPYAIYGIHDWKRNRESSDTGHYGQLHIWRIYDYPHIVQMYLSMYRIARYHGHIETDLSADEYLERAYRTAIAFFTYPEEVIGWSPYQTGNYNELAIVDVIDELEVADLNIKAKRLRHHWEKKVAYFMSGEANLFGSEYPYDTTGFESTHAFARYAMAIAGRPVKERDIITLQTTREDAFDFMNRQVQLNVGTRGRLEKAYYLYGSDYRGGGSARYTLSYMAQMGGWSLLNYALHFDDDPNQYLKLAYGSILSSWALMNTGTEESNYGYWFPSKINDGGAGGGFEPLAYGSNWLQLEHGRGSWYYGCEIDLGFTGYLRAAATILADDPVFGLTAFGGTLDGEGDEIRVIPKDGVRRRFHILRGDHRFHLKVRYDRFASDEPITVDQSLRRISFTLENVGNRSHDTMLNLSGLQEGSYSVMMDGKNTSEVTIKSRDTEVEVALLVSSEFHRVDVELVD